MMEIRIYYEDTDAGGVVYYASYLKFAERGRTELLRSLGFENKTLRDQHGVLFVVRHVEADYIRPAHLDDLLRIDTSIVQLKNASVVMKQSIFRKTDEVFSMSVKLACVAADEYKPTGLPEGIRRAFEQHMKNA